MQPPRCRHAPPGRPDLVGAELREVICVASSASHQVDTELREVAEAAIQEYAGRVQEARPTVEELRQLGARAVAGSPPHTDYCPLPSHVAP